ncbi:MAG: hypothetical protein R2909_07315, partial [Gemmatimonadales bacterium]
MSGPAGNAERGERIARLTSRTFELVGPAVVGATLIVDRRWLDEPVLALVVVVATALLRAAPIRLSKFSYLNQTGLVAIVAAVATPASVAVLGLWVGTFISDRLFLRKTVYATMVNAGREVLAFALAFGPYAATVRWIGLQHLSLEFLPALAVLVGGYFFSSRILFYFSLHVRDKLVAGDRVF